MVKHGISAIILAGGLSRRMGEDKRALPLDGKTLLKYSVDLARKFSDDILISANDYLPVFSEFRVIPDREEGAGPLLAIASVLPHIKYSDSLVLTCDMPFINEEIIQNLINHHVDAKISLFRFEQMAQPFPSIVPKSSLREIEKIIGKNIRSMKMSLEELPVNFLLPDTTLNEHTFLNINRPEDVWKAGKFLAKFK